MALAPRDRLKIRVLYRLKDFERLFRFVGENRERRAFLCGLICEKRRRFSERFRREFKPSGKLLEDVLAIYKAYFDIKVPRDGKIVKADENEVIIDWFNPCPVLEALKKVGLDARTFCRDVYEKPVQVLFDELLPYKVEFTRDYNHIRPYADACREIYRRVN